ncbi:MAG TPA: DegV family protein [Ktedonobacterales bacterium]|nr:DegV family protein [Ktedonobacterales bacterium]
MSDYTRSPWAHQSNPIPNRPHVRIVTDSASDILPSHAQAIGAFVVPSWIAMDGAYLRDGIDISASQFYSRLPHLRTPPHTEPATPQEFYHVYQTAFRQGATAVVSIHVSSHLSKIVEHARIARDYLSPGAIDIIDSLQAGIGMWPAVIRAAQLARMGAPLAVIHETTVSILARTRLYALVESLEQLRRNGRIGRARELIGTLLDAHPIITVEQGEVTPVETVRTRARGLARLRELVENAGELETLLICGASVESIGQLETVLAGTYRGIIQKTWLGPAIGSNTGPCVAVALVARQ